ncbi:MAG: Wzz/FepE/Etk N-terminal domain-containing protein [Erysipelotrichaceae bacterium]|nr:Wzz/FepE/Etk N-terminal domain-containing protein [Erysipelotrichaceae bacterium]
MNNRDDFVEIDLLRILEIVRNEILIILAIFIVCCTAGYAFGRFFVEDKYTATAKMIVLQDSNTNSNSNYTSSDQAFAQKLVNTYSQIIMSDAIADPVVTNLDLIKKYGINSNGYKNIVSVSSADNTEVINVSVTTNDPVLSADIANEVVNVFEEKIYSIMKIENVTTLTSAKTPTSRAGSNNKYISIGAIIAAVISIVMVLIIYFTDSKVKSEEEVKQIFDKYPIIGSIPEFDTNDQEDK